MKSVKNRANCIKNFNYFEDRTAFASKAPYFNCLQNHHRLFQICISGSSIVYHFIFAGFADGIDDKMIFISVDYRFQSFHQLIQTLVIYAALKHALFDPDSIIETNHRHFAQAARRA